MCILNGFAHHTLLLTLNCIKKRLKHIYTQKYKKHVSQSKIQLNYFNCK